MASVGFKSVLRALFCKKEGTGLLDFYIRIPNIATKLGAGRSSHCLRNR